MAERGVQKEMANNRREWNVFCRNLSQSDRTYYDNNNNNNNNKLVQAFKLLASMSGGRGGGYQAHDRSRGGDHYGHDRNRGPSMVDKAGREAAGKENNKEDDSMMDKTGREAAGKEDNKEDDSMVSKEGDKKDGSMANKAGREAAEKEDKEEKMIASIDDEKINNVDGNAADQADDNWELVARGMPRRKLFHLAV